MFLLTDLKNNQPDWFAFLNSNDGSLITAYYVAVGLGPLVPAFNKKTERSIVFTDNHFFFGMKDRNNYIRVCKFQHNPSVLNSWCMGTYKLGNVYSTTIDIS